MSAYQYYEFLAVDRPLDAGDQAQLRAISSRARITAHGFANQYDWGDLSGDPVEMMTRWFDLHVHVADWASRTFMVRLPRRLFDPRLFEPYADDENFRVVEKDGSLILRFGAIDMELDRTDDGTGWMAVLAPLRSQLLEGDLRCLYLIWLLQVQ